MVSQYYDAGKVLLQIFLYQSNLRYISQMPLLNFEIHEKIPFADGQSFGDAGAYTKMVGVARFAVDPTHPANDSIIDLKRAPVNRHGQVEFSSSLEMIVPNQRASGAPILMDIPNRGRMLSMRMFNGVPRDVLDTDEPGDGFLFKKGFSLACPGWQWDVGKEEGAWCRAPVATDDGKPIYGEVVCRIQPNRNSKTLHFGQLGKPSYAPDADHVAQARLFKQHHDGAELLEIHRDDWQFGKSTDTGLEVSDAHITSEKGFVAGCHYELIYTAKDPVVAGVGLLVVRDLATALRSGQVSPDLAAWETIYGFGASQTGRFLRHFIYEGLNVDEKGERAFDGLIPHIAGSQRLDINHRFAQPSSPGAPGFNRLFPFSNSNQHDPMSGSAAGLLDKLKALDAVPKIISINTAWEYWRGDASLIHTLPDGSGDADLDTSERVYLLAGTHHIGGIIPPVAKSSLLDVNGQYPFNIVDHSPLVRAALVNLDQWVRNEIEPPASRYPRLNDGTARKRREILDVFRAIPEMNCLDPEQLAMVRYTLSGLDTATGVAHFPLQEGLVRPTYVSAIDEDFNETAGIRLPDISVPVASHSGWHPRHESTGAAAQACIFVGFSLFLAVDEKISVKTGDPRISIEARYASKNDYLELVTSAAHILVEENLLLAEDVAAVIENCSIRYDLAVEASLPDLPT